MELLRPKHKTHLKISQEVAARSHYHSDDGGTHGESLLSLRILIRPLQRELEAPRKVSGYLRRCKEGGQMP